MKLDYDCARDLLLVLEEEFKPSISMDGSIMFDPIRIDILCDNNSLLNKYAKADVIYTALKLEEAGFIDATSRLVSLNQEITCHHITYQGHVYLDTVRPQETWKKIKTFLTSHSLPMTFDVITDVAGSLVKNVLSLQ